MDKLIKQWGLACVVCLTLSVLFLSPSVKAESVKVIELTTGWSLINQNKSIVKQNLDLPTGVFGALYGEDVLNSYNDVNMRWIAKDNWTYSRNFSIDLEELKNVGFVNLTFYGIDTIAEIRLNSRILGHTDNMFVRYSYNVQRFLKTKNLLEVAIKSPIYAASKKAAALQDFHCEPSKFRGECHRNVLRKMQISFSWDFSLAAPSIGIWRPVTLELHSVGLIRDIDVDTSKNETHWLMDVRVFIEASGGRDFYALLYLSCEDLMGIDSVVYNYTQKRIPFNNPVINIRCVFPLEKISPWWPNGHGEQKLYVLNFTLDCWLENKKHKSSSRTVSHKTINVGFRTIELVEDEIEWGTTFYFKVNDKEIFMKGSNYVPSHILPEYGADEVRVKHLLKSAKDAHMNMLRVWGGGVYESDYFYNLADQYGLLIWQDMMFACARYPAVESFLSSVRTEIRQNALRLGHHASIAIFSTSNEIENSQTTEYFKLYVKTIIAELEVIAHKSRPKPLVSSPSNGLNGNNEFAPNNPNYGDAHVYSYFGNLWQVDEYLQPRFVSEFGFHSLAALSTWRHTLGKNDSLLHLIEHRDHTPAKLRDMIERNFFKLPDRYDSAKYVKALVYLSQINQALSTKMKTEIYRSLRNTKRRTMGALYWQLNDVWVTTSWSSIDFYGNYKLLHHWAKEFMAPIVVIALNNPTKKTIKISLACDEQFVYNNNLKVIFNIYRWNSFFSKASETWNVTLKPNGVQYVKELKHGDIFNFEITSKNCFLEFLLQNGTVQISKTYVFPARFSAIVGLTNPDLRFEIVMRKCESVDDFQFHIYRLAIFVTHPAAFVYIEVIHKDIIQYSLSRNGFMLTSPFEIIELKFKHQKCIFLNSQNFEILTLYDFQRSWSKWDTDYVDEY